MDDTILFENITQVQEKSTTNLDLLFASSESGKKKNFERELVWGLTLIAVGTVMMLIFWSTGLFVTETKIGNITHTRYASWCVYAAAAIGLIAAFIVSAVWMKVRYDEGPVSAPEPPQTYVTYVYTYKISDSMIKVLHEGTTDCISFEDIEKITSNGHSYFICAKNKKYRIGKNGFGGKEKEFEQFMRGKGFSIGIEP